MRKYLVVFLIIGLLFGLGGEDRTTTAVSAFYKSWLQLTGTSNDTIVAVATRVQDGAGYYAPFSLGTDSLVVHGYTVLEKKLTVIGGQALSSDFEKASLVDNTATLVFSVRTTNEAGDVDGGAWALKIFALGSHNAAPSAKGAGMSVVAHLAHANDDGGTPGTSAVTEISQSAVGASAAGTKTVDGIVITAVETSNYQTDIKFAVDLAGSEVGTGEVVAFTELAWYGYTTAPTHVQE